MNDRATINSVGKAFRVLELFSGSNSGYTLTEIVRKLRFSGDSRPGHENGDESEVGKKEVEMKWLVHLHFSGRLRIPGDSRLGPKGHERKNHKALFASGAGRQVVRSGEKGWKSQALKYRQHHSIASMAANLSFSFAETRWEHCGKVSPGGCLLRS